MPAMPFAACTSTTVTLSDGRVLVSLGGCNYLGLSHHPAVMGAVAQAIGRFGLSSTASRETTGNATPHEALEREAASFLGVPSALLTPDGYIANVAACQGLAALGIGRAIIDSRAHASLRDAAKAAGLRISLFEHGDVGSLSRELARAKPAGAAVLTDGVFTADGEPARLRELLLALDATDVLIVDDCHGLGVLGPGGRGSASEAGVDDPRVLITSSLAKGLGCAGGVVAGARELVGAARRSTAYVCTTPIAPAMAEGTRAALALLRAEPERVARLRECSTLLRARLAALGLVGEREGAATPICAFVAGDDARMGTIRDRLLERGFRAPLIAYPGGPAASYFRVTVCADHTPAQIESFAAALREVLGSDIRAGGLTPTPLVQRAG